MSDLDWRGARWIAMPSASGAAGNKWGQTPINSAEENRGQTPIIPLDGSLPVFRRAVRIDKPIARAVAHLCGLGQHELRINGVKAGDDVLEPGWTNYRKSCIYVTHDVTSLVRGGADNTIDVLLGNGMYHVGSSNRYKKFKASFGPPKLIFLMQIDFADGSSESIVSNDTWRCAPGPITFSCIYGGEDHDALRESPADWKPVAIVDGPGGELIRQIAPPVRVMESLAGKAVSHPEPGVTVFDCGQNMSGWPAVRVRGPAGSSVRLITGELLDARGRVTQRNSGAPVWFDYMLQGGTSESGETWQPRFSLTGFRYVEAHAHGCEVLNLDGQFVHSSAKPIGTFECSSDLLNRIHRLIVAAIKSNLHSVMTDCPHREKLGWLEQTHLVGPGILWNFDAAGLYRKISRDMRDAQRDDGGIPSIAPQYVVFNEPWAMFNESPEWGSAAVINPWLIWQRTGERTMIEENYDSMRRYLEYLHARAGDDGRGGIVAFGLADWYDIGEGNPGFSKLTSSALTGTAIFHEDLAIMSKAAALLGKHDDAARFAAIARDVRQAFNDRLFDRTSNNYDRGSQAANAMAIALGLVEPQHRAAVLDNLVADIRRHGNHITAGDIGFKFVIAALAESGRSDVVFDLLSRTDPPSYGAQLARGATTLTEAWDANPRNSQNHLMLGHAEAWFYEWLAGIQIDLSQAPPRQFVIRPNPVGDVTWAAASHESALGRIECRWERAATAGESTGPPKCRLRISIPRGATATVMLRDRPPQVVGDGETTIE